jgi:hypothetical protein
MRRKSLNIQSPLYGWRYCSYHVKFPVLVKKSWDSERCNTTSNKWKICINNASLLGSIFWFNQYSIETWPVHPQEKCSYTMKQNINFPYSLWFLILWFSYAEKKNLATPTGYRNTILINDGICYLWCGMHVILKSLEFQNFYVTWHRCT